MFNNNRDEDFLAEFRAFLENETTLSVGTINTYLNKIRNILKNGYSVGDLCGAVDNLINDYSKDGIKYNPRDRRQTLSALKKVNLFVLKKMLDSLGEFIIARKSGWTSFPPQGKHLAEYVICNDIITLKYREGFGPISEVEAKVIPSKELKFLVNLIKTAQEKDLLADSNTACNTVHGKIMSYDYQINGRYATESSLFKRNYSKTADELCKDYDDLIGKLIG